MVGNVEQQLNLERMHAQYVMDMMKGNANQQIVNQTLQNNGLPTVRQCDESTHTYDLVQSNDVEMKTVM